MRIICDMDDVLLHTHKHWLKLYNEKWDDNLKVEEITSWGMEKHVKPECGKSVNAILYTPGFYSDPETIEGAIDGVKKLIDSGHDVIIATATPPKSKTAYNEKVAWIREKMPFFRMKNFSSMYRKELLSGDIMFDDGPHNLEQFKGISVAMNRPWNKNAKCEYRANGWDDFLRIVDEINQTRKHHGSLINKRINERLWDCQNDC